MRSAVTIGVTALLTSLFLLPASPQSACAQDANHAGVVVKFSQLDERSFCISFDTDSISGIQALRRTGLEVVTKPYGSMGEFVCKIDGVGSDLDSCPDRDGSHWGYYHSSSSGWKKSGLGPSSYQVQCGGLEGWAWLPQGSGSAPSSTSFTEVCPGASCATAAEQSVGSSTPGPPDSSSGSAGSDSSVRTERPVGTTSSAAPETSLQPSEITEADSTTTAQNALPRDRQVQVVAQPQPEPAATAYGFLAAVLGGLLVLRHLVSRRSGLQ